MHTEFAQSVLCADQVLAEALFENTLGGNVISLEVICDETSPPAIVAAGVLKACYGSLSAAFFERHKGALRRFQLAYNVVWPTGMAPEGEKIAETRTPFRYAVSQDQRFLVVNLAQLIVEFLNQPNEKHYLFVKVRNSEFVDDFSALFMQTVVRLAKRACFLFDATQLHEDAVPTSVAARNFGIMRTDAIYGVAGETSLFSASFGNAYRQAATAMPGGSPAVFDSSVQYAERLSSAGYYAAALYWLNKVESIGESGSEAAQALFFQIAFTCNCCLSAGPQALEVAKKQLAAGEINQWQTEIVRAHHNIATVYLRLYDQSFLELAKLALKSADHALAVHDGQLAMLRAFIKNTHALWYFKCGRLQRALTLLDEAIAICSSLQTNDPRAEIEHGTLLFNRFQLLQAAGDTEEALECLRRAIQIEPTNMTFRHAEGNALAKAGDSTGALKSYQLSRECGYDTPDLLLSVAFSQEAAGFNDGCLETLALLRQLYPDNLVGFLDACRILRDMGSARDAKAIVQAAVEWHPDNEKVWAEVANIHHDLGDIASAEEAYKKAISLDGSAIEPTIGLAVLYFENERYSDCHNYLMSALEIDPADETALENLKMLGAKG